LVVLYFSPYARMIVWRILRASMSATTSPAIRVTIVDDATQEILPTLQAA
jgi:hypothetical protein